MLFGLFCTSCLFTSYFTIANAFYVVVGVLVPALEEQEVNKKAEETQDFSVLPDSGSTAWTEEN